MKTLLVIFTSFILSSCVLFMKFSGTDVLHKEGKKSKSYTEIKRLWCSQCGCEAIKINKYEKHNLVMEMLLNCTEGCPPGDKSYKIENHYEKGQLVSTDYYFLVTIRKLDWFKLPQLSYEDSVLIRKTEQFKKEAFFSNHCAAIPYQFKGYERTTKSQIEKFPTGETGL